MPKAATGVSAAASPRPNSAPSCVPAMHEVENLELHQLASEWTDWKAPDSPKGPTQVIKILGFNDFHGQLSPPPAIDGRPVGGAAVLAAYFRQAAEGHQGVTLAVHAGDLIGASPPASALNQDEPTVEFLGSILGPGCSRSEREADSCHVVAGLGNHEFDEGQTEFERIVDGGRHKNGPFLGHDYLGAPFEYIGANVHVVDTGKPLVKPFVVKQLDGTKVGLVGAVLRGAPVFIMPSGIEKLSFDDEVTAINAVVDQLSNQGVHTIVVVLHQGGFQCFAPGVAHDRHSVTGPIVDIVRQLHPDVDLVVSGHTHSVINALLPNSGGQPTLVTQAFHAGTAFADIELTVDRATSDVIEKRASIVTPFADQAPGDRLDPQVVALVRAAEDSVQTKTARKVGVAKAPILAMPDPAGNSMLGDLIVDAQREVARTDLAFTTPSWVRGNLERGALTWGELFRVQPFGNRLMKMELTGQQVVDLLNQQWVVQNHPRILHVSGLTYQWDAERPASDRVIQVSYRGKPIDRKRRFSVVVNEYLAEGGDSFEILAALPRHPTGLSDIEALERYVKKHSPLSPTREARITRLH